MKFILLMIIGAGFSACSSYERAFVSLERLPVQATVSNTEMDSLVAPYRRALAIEMNRIIGTAVSDMQVARPNSPMGQWVADVLLAYGKDSLVPANDRELPVIAILNTGGLRASFSQGAITVGDVYKLMPFDNLLVAVKLPVEKLSEIREYLKTTGGEPIAGFRIVKGELVTDLPLADARFFWVITTDFLANGGDKMYFFQSAAQKIPTALTLRDLLLKEVAVQQVINVRLEERVQF